MTAQYITVHPDNPQKRFISQICSIINDGGVAYTFTVEVAGKNIIRWIQKKQIGEEIRDLGLEGQMQKKGTPTMGGIIIFLAIIIPVLLFSDLTNIYTILLLMTTVCSS